MDLEASVSGQTAHPLSDVVLKSLLVALVKLL
jgi:hypothetical protein